MHSNKYIFIYSSVMVVVVAIALTIVAIQLKPAQEMNIRIEKMQNILISVNMESTPKNAEDLYKKYIISDFVLNEKGEETKGINAFEIDFALEMKKVTGKRNLPVFIAKMDNGDTNYIFPLRGKGLWGPVWGYLSVKSDFNTVVGTQFGHKGETPGLGAEIDTRKFQMQFANKKMFDEKGILTSVAVKKGGADPGDVHGVDAISGGTITSNGVSHMLLDGMKLYEPYLKKHVRL